MDPRERAKLRSEISTAFETGSIFKLITKKNSCNIYNRFAARTVPNEAVGHRGVASGDSR